MPNIFIHQRHVGGCDAVHAMHDRDELLKLFNEKK